MWYSSLAYRGLRGAGTTTAESNESAFEHYTCYADDMQVRAGTTDDEINSAIAIDEFATGLCDRAKYIATIAEQGGLTLAFEQGKVVGFCCYDRSYFFEKPFISLLIIEEKARQRGFGRALLRAVAGDRPEIWTSTNRSNSAMRSLLKKEGWDFCGELHGLDVDDPELFFKKSS